VSTENAVFIRRKTVRGYDYFQIVEGYRDDHGRVRHRTVASLGHNPTIKAALTSMARDDRRDAKELERYRKVGSDTWVPPATVRAIAAAERRIAQRAEKRAALKAITDLVG